MRPTTKPRPPRSGLPGSGWADGSLDVAKLVRGLVLNILGARGGKTFDAIGVAAMLSLTSLAAVRFGAPGSERFVVDEANCSVPLSSPLERLLEALSKAEPGAPLTARLEEAGSLIQKLRSAVKI
jgi:hypothetical protein